MIDVASPSEETTVPSGKKKWIRRVLVGLVLIALLPPFVFSCTAVSVYRYGNQSSKESADAAIVLGAAVWTDHPSPVFRERILHAVELWKDGRVEKVIFTGGKGEPHEPAESHAARDLALLNGLPIEAVIVETQSHNTLENLQHAAQVGEAYGLHTFLIVSDPIHMRRAMTMAEDVGLDAYSSPTPTTRYRTWSTKRKFLMQETWYYLRYRTARFFFDEEAYETLLQQSSGAYISMEQLTGV